MYDSNFIVPIQPNDVSVKIQNTSGICTHIIREMTCTIKIEGPFLVVKQSAEGQFIKLQFSSSQDCINAHVMLRTALSTVLNNQQRPSTVSSKVYSVSSDVKNESPTSPTSYDGQKVMGITGLVDPADGTVEMFVNGHLAQLGDSCNSTTFYSPTFDYVMAKEYLSYTKLTSTTIQIGGTFDFVVGDSVIVLDGGTCKCFDVVQITGNVITINAAMSGMISSLFRPKRFDKISVGDLPLWFGSHPGYELDTSDTISFSYLTHL